MLRSNINFYRFCRGLARLLALVFFAGGNLFAQNPTGTLRGPIRGRGGAPIGRSGCPCGIV